MSADREERPRESLARLLLAPRVVFPALAAVVLLAVLLAPEGNRAGDQRLTSHSTAPMGARGLYDLSHRLGWAPLRRTAPLQGRLDSAAVYLVLDPPIEMGARESGALLAAVRRGAGLLYVVRPSDALAESLHVSRSDDGLPQDTRTRPGGACTDRQNRTHGIGWPNGLVNSYWIETRAPYPSDTVTFLRVRREPPIALRRRQGAEGSESKGSESQGGAASKGSESIEGSASAMGSDSAKGSDSTDSDPTDDSRSADDRPGITAAPAAVGFALGRGRVIVVADPDWLRNDVVRVCRWRAAPAAARMLGWLSAPRAALPAGTRRLVFDEYHQGFGAYAGSTGALRDLAFGTPWGRAVLQGSAAALILLLALGPRPLPPARRERVERRSALEHVGALARAYEKVGATRLATRRLVRGARRRRGGMHAIAGRGASDEEWLRDVAMRHPAVGADARTVLAALEEPVTAAELLAVGQAIDSLERALSR